MFQSILTVAVRNRREEPPSWDDMGAGGYDDEDDDDDGDYAPAMQQVIDPSSWRVRSRLPLRRSSSCYTFV